MNKQFAYVLSLVMLVACGKVENGNSSKGGDYDRQVFEKVQRQICGNSGKLADNPTALNVPFENLADQSSIFTIVNPEQNNRNCALDAVTEKQIATSNGTVWFRLNANANCVQNNSMWQVIRSQRVGTTHYFTLQSLDSSTTPNIDLQGSPNLSGIIVRDNAHLRILTCQ